MTARNEGVKAHQLLEKFHSVTKIPEEDMAFVSTFWRLHFMIALNLECRIKEFSNLC